MNRDQVRSVVISGYTIKGTRANGETFETTRPAISDPRLIDDLLDHNVVVEGQQPEQRAFGLSFWSPGFPILIILGFMFFMRQMQAAVAAVAAR